MTKRTCIPCWARITAASLLAIPIALEAGRRSLRIDFGAWSDVLALGTLDCPGSAADDASVTQLDHQFVGSDSNTYLVNAYCQSANTWTPDADVFDYLNSTTVPFDEEGLALKIGDNDSPPLITGLRYSFLDRDGEDPDVDGFQWAFFFFPGGVTLVALYGETPVGSPDFLPRIEHQGSPVWQASTDGFDGEYFCFDGTTFIGFWDGEVPGGSNPEHPAAGCTLPPPPELVMADGFESTPPP